MAVILNAKGTSVQSFQIGKQGPLLKHSTGTIEFRNTADDAFIEIKADLPTTSDSVATKQYVDSVATGLDTKNAVRAATNSASDVSGFTYTASLDDGTSQAAAWTSVSAPVFDGITLADGDRILIKDSDSDQKGNGIWTYNSSDSTFERGIDADNTPSNEVSGGMFCFVEEGNINSDTGFVLSSPNGVVTLGTDDLVFAQFSRSAAIIAGNGLVKTGSILDVIGTASRISVSADAIDIDSGYVGQTSITTLGTIINFASTGIDDNASSTALTIDVNERLGITEATPLSPLHITNSGTSITARFQTNQNSDVKNIFSNNPNTGTAAAQTIELNNNFNGLQLSYYGHGFTSSGSKKLDGGRLQNNGVGGMSLVAEHGSGNLRFYTGGAADLNERMTIDSGGQILINTTTTHAAPGKLFIADNAVSTYGQIIVGNTGGAAWMFGRDNASTGDFKIGELVNSADTIPTEAFRIEAATDNVGIGITGSNSPNGKLDVTNAVDQVGIQINHSASTGAVKSAIFVNNTSSSGQGLRISNAGSTGALIGLVNDTSSARMFEGRSEANTNGFNMKMAHATFSQRIIELETVRAATIGFNFLRFRTNVDISAVDVFAVKGDGSTGVGTGSPASKLDVNGDFRADNFSNRNRLINGSFDIWQRGTSFTPAANGQIYTTDRWFMNRNGVSDWTVSRQGNAEQYSCRIQRDSGTTSTQPMRMRSLLESSDCWGMAGNVVTVSFDMKVGANYSASSNNVVLGIVSGTGIDESSTTLATGLTGAVSASSSHSGTTDWVRYSASTATLGSTVSQLGILLSGTPIGTAGANDWFEIRNVQIEISGIATEFEHRSYQQELALCQRYLPAFDAESTTGILGAGFVA